LLPKTPKPQILSMTGKSGDLLQQLGFPLDQNPGQDVPSLL